MRQIIFWKLRLHILFRCVDTFEFAGKRNIEETMFLLTCECDAIAQVMVWILPRSSNSDRTYIREAADHWNYGKTNNLNTIGNRLVEIFSVVISFDRKILRQFALWCLWLTKKTSTTFEFCKRLGHTIIRKLVSWREFLKKIRILEISVEQNVEKIYVFGRAGQ